MATQNATAMQSEFVGKRFRFLVVERIVPVGLRAARLQCVCDCGTTTLARAYELRRGEKVSCGCWKKKVLGESTRTHGQSNSRISGYANRTYGIWQAMHDRCKNKNRSDYPHYGGRGIKVCKRWHEYENFVADMGEAPPTLTLDRREVNKGYAPSNCRWATRKQQSNNTTRTVWYTHKGVTERLAYWLLAAGVNRDTYYKRRKQGQTLGQALGLSGT